MECDVGVVNCEDALKWKVVALTEAEKEQSRLQRTVEERDMELAKVRAELDVERRARTDVK
jgi:hypothetical protein